MSITQTAATGTAHDGTVPTGLTPAHVEFLAKQAISPETMLAAGAYSATQECEVPEDLRWVGSSGIVFAHHRPDSKVVYQFRPDEPKDGRKYVQQKRAAGDTEDKGSIISVHPWFAESLAEGVAGKTVAMIEGTKQYLAFVEATRDLRDDADLFPGGLLAFGVQGCQNWSHDGVVVPDMDLVLMDAARLVVMFDADRETNYFVYQAGVRITEVAKGFGVKDVRYARMGGLASASSKAGLDDVLGTRAPGEARERIVRAMVANATDKPGKCPPKPTPKTVTEDVCRIDWTGGATYEPSTISIIGGQEMVEESKKKIAEFAAKIDRTVAIIDDLNPSTPDIEHDLSVKLEGDPVVYKIRSVPDSALREIPYWLNQAGEGRGARRTYANSDAGARSIESTLRAYEADDAVIEKAYRRTGWVRCDDEIWRYLTPQGAIGPDGRIPTPKSRLENHTYQQCYAVADPGAYSPEEHRHALAEFLGIKDRLGDPTIWYAVLGAMAYAATGAPPKSGLIVVGKHGSGKTVVTQTAAAAFGPEFSADGGRLMGSMNGTSNAVGALGNGLHHSVAIVDDVRRRQSPKAQEAQDQGMEDLIRKSYEGGSAGRARMRVDRRRDGRVVTDSPDGSWPLVIFTAEYLPSAEAVGSSVERLLSITVTQSDTMKPGETDNLRAIGSSGRPAIAWSGFLAWLGREINAQQAADPGKSGHVEFLDLVEGYREQFMTALSKFQPDLSARSREVAAPPVVGWYLLLTYAEEIGVLTPEQAAALHADAQAKITDAALRHTRVELSIDLTPGQRVLARTRALLSAGEARFDGATEGNLNKPVVAKRCERTIYDVEGNPTEGAQVVALNPDALAKALGDLTGTRIIDALREVAARNKDGRYGWTVSINGVQIRNALMVPEAEWGAFEGVDGADDAA